MIIASENEMAVDRSLEKRDELTGTASPETSVLSSLDRVPHQQQNKHQQQEPQAFLRLGEVSIDTKRTKQCTGCGCNILDAGLLRLADSYWHSDCLRCSICQARLQDIGSTCFTRDEMILCRTDYIRLFGGIGAACSRCGKTISSDGLVMRTTQQQRLIQRPDHHHHHQQQSHGLYHLDCFSCIVCNRKLNPGDRYGLLQGNVVCEQDYAQFYDVM